MSAPVTPDAPAEFGILDTPEPTTSGSSEFGILADDDPGLIRSAVNAAGDFAKGVNTGIGMSLAGADRDAANFFMTADNAAEILHQKTGLSKGDALKRIEGHFRSASHEIALEIERRQGADGEGPGKLERFGQIIGALPVGLGEAMAAIAITRSPTTGLAILGGIGRADEGLLAAAKGAVGGAVVGKTFGILSRAGAGRTVRAGTLGAVGTGVALAQGSTGDEALTEGAVLGTLGIFGAGKRGVKVRELSPKEIKAREAEALKIREERLLEEAEALVEKTFVDAEGKPVTDATPRNKAAERELQRSLDDESPSNAVWTMFTESFGEPTRSGVLRGGNLPEARRALNEWGQSVESTGLGIDAAVRGKTPEAARIRAELEEGFAPIREELRRRHGDTLRLYRGESASDARVERGVVSFSAEPEMAGALLKASSQGL